MPKLLGRPKVRRAILERHGIYYHEEVYGRKGTTPTISIPNHVDQLREALLDFSGIQIADSWKTVLSKEETDLRKAHRRQGINDSDCDLKPPESAYFDPEQLRLSDHYRNEKMEILEHDICISNSIAFDARKLDYDSENRWISFLKDQFFARYEDYVDHD
jgi:hypothetical protein